MTIRTPNDSYYVSGASGGQNHTLPFGADRFEDDDLFVYVWNTSTEAWDKKTVTTHYTVSSTQVSFTSGNIPSTRVIVLRKTDVDEDFPKADFVAGASIKAQDLDNNQLQALRGIKELRDQKLSAVPSIEEDGTPSNPKMYANLDMNGYKVINQPTGYITSTDILDGTIATADVADSAITAAKLASDSVTTAKIASDAVNGSKIADDSINSEHYVDGSIDTAHIADAQITTAKIANDAVTADKLANTAVTAGSYTAADITVDAQGRVTAASSGTIGTSEIADDAVTTAKILDANVTTAKIADSAVTTAKIADAELVELATMGGNTASALADLTQSEVQILDGATVTTAELNILDGVTATATELNQLDGNTLKASSTDFTSSSQFPSASEIDARITARIDPLGGFEAIANEDSFPATAPPAGTVISIANANGLAVNSSGVGAGTRAGGSDAVVINGFPSTFNSTSLDDGIGLLVVATSTAHTYDFHRVVAKNEDVRQLSSDINDFKARYRIGSSNPTTDNDAGDLFFNTGTSKMLVRNAGNTAWQEVQAVGDFFINTISSSSGTGGGSATFNGSAYRFTLSNAPTYAQQLLVSINGVVQKPNSGTSQPSEGFAIDGGDIILAAAPATGADAFFITIGSSVGIGTPSDNTISTAKIIDGAVTTAKLAADAVTGAKIADDAVGAEHIEVLDANLQFADSVKAQFGAGNDLQIYHDGSHSRIVDAGTGNLITQTNRFSVHSADDSETMIDAVADSHVKLYHNGSEKLATKSDGIDVTGEVQCDSLDVDGGHINLESGYSLQWGDSHERIEQSDTKLEFFTNNSEQMTLNGSNLGIGTTSPSSALHILGTDTAYSANVAVGAIATIADTAGRTLQIVAPGSVGEGGIGTSTNHDFTLFTGNTEKVRLTQAGNVGIGTTAPNGLLTVQANSGRLLTFRNSTTGTGSSDGSYIALSGSDLQISNAESANTIFYTGDTERMRIDSSGNVGINNTSPADKLHVGGNIRFGTNTTYYGVIEHDASTTGANIYTSKDTGGHIFKTGLTPAEVVRIENSGVVKLTQSGNNPRFGSLEASGDAFRLKAFSGNASHIASMQFFTGADSPSERMRIDSSGRVGIGVSSPAATLHLSDANHGVAAGYVGGTLPNSAGIYTSSNSAYGQTYGSLIVQSRGDYSGYGISFRQSNAERMRIRGNGFTRFSNNTADSDFYANSNPFHGFHSSSGDSATLIVENSHDTAPYGILVDFSDDSPDNNTNYFIRCSDSTQANRMVVYSDGDIDNHDNSYSGLSDLKLKQDVVDAASQWDDIKDLRVRKFKFKSDVAAYGDQAKTLIGVVAQEAELVSPGLVKESPDRDSEGNDLGTTTKSVRYSVLYMKAIKALQEAIDRIETLETQNASLEARLTALEGGS